jgi:photosystem II stability/assembly factor-like uncharacterized protein
MLISQSVPQALAAGCDSAQFVSDLTIPDGSSFAPRAALTKTWRLSNNGTCTWNTNYSVVWAGGDGMGPTTSVRLPVSVPPGQMLDISVNLIAPSAAGHYKSLWKLSNASGSQFGIGSSGNDPFWVDINVIDINAVVYDFVTNAPYAQWKSGAGLLPYPGTSGDSRGYSFSVNNPHLEDDSFASEPGLLTVPQNKFNGYIQATYPEFQVQAGDKLQTLVNCEFGASACYVTFRIDYILPNGVQKTLWSWKEAYDRRFYRANLDLTSLTGQKVKFVFMLLSTGLASGDRAIWGSPRIVRTGTTQPPAPPATLTALPPLTPTATPITPPPPTPGPAGCDRATFVSDVTVQDGTTFAPGEAFTKTWRLKNSGSCTWTTAYKLVYYSGEQMSAPTTVNLPWGAVRDQTVDISVNMVAPTGPGQYRGFWILANASGQFFGIGANASDPIWVSINVAGDSPSNNASYDFLANVCSAEWKSGAGTLPCPGTDGDSRGLVLSLNPAKLEDGTADTPGLLTFPQFRYNGYIQGTYPTFTVQPGDHFKTIVGCEYGSSCYVDFRLDYMAANGFIGTFWQRREQNEGIPHAVDVDLTPLAGRSVRFILTLLATGYASNDRAVWAAPRIERAASPTTPTITPVPPQWLTYTNQQYGFQFMYPPQSQILSQSPTYLKMNLPFTSGTNLVEKYLETVVVENANPCQSPLSPTSPPGSPTETVVINGISFLKQMGGDAAAGNHYEWVAYSTLHGNACISMDFVLHSLGAIDPPPPNFDKAAESAVFDQIMSTFGWTTPSVTPSFTPTSTTSTTPVPGSGVIVPAPDIQKLFMQDAATGWAIGNSYILWTMNGGGTWYNVNPPGISSVQNGFFQDWSRGWVLATVSDSGLPVLLRTTNGGSTWTSYGNLPFNGGYIQFLDNMNGFVLSGEASGMNKQAVSLYQTIDGGATWTLKYANDPSQPNNSLPFSGHKNGMAFRDTTHGWVGGDIPTPGFAYFYRTDNGGTSWTQQPLAIPTGYESAGISITAPSFFGSNDAVLPVWMSTNAGRDLFIYTTHDGGTTWNASASFAHQSFNTSIATMTDTFTWDPAGFFHVTNDGGANWRQVNSNVDFGDSVRDMDFVSPFHGWVVDVDTNGNLALYRTSDGGITWNALYGNTAPPSLPDLTVSGMWIELQNPSCLNPGDALGVRLRVTNNGQGATGAFTVRVNDVDQTLNGLGPGETTSMFFPSYNNPVTAIVDATNLVAESNENNNLVTQIVAVPTQPLPCSTPFTTPSIPSPTITPAIVPSITPTPMVLSGPYAVVNVSPNDVLNIRSGAGSSQPMVGSFPASTTNVMRTGPTASADGATWVEVQNPSGGTGWVNSSYLTEYVTHEAFCADGRVPALIEQLKGSVNQSNGGTLSALVSPVHGMDVQLWLHSPAVNFNTGSTAPLFTSADSYNWGVGPSSIPDVGTFSQVIQPKLQEVFNSTNMETHCDDLTNVFNHSQPWPYTNIRFYNLYKPAAGDQLDFRTWLIGIEYINGQPYLHSLVSIVWEP